MSPSPGGRRLPTDLTLSPARPTPPRLPPSRPAAARPPASSPRARPRRRSSVFLLTLEATLPPAAMDAVGITSRGSVSVPVRTKVLPAKSAPPAVVACLLRRQVHARLAQPRDQLAGSPRRRTRSRCFRPPPRPRRARSAAPPSRRRGEFVQRAEMRRQRPRRTRARHAGCPGRRSAATGPAFLLASMPSRTFCADFSAMRSSPESCSSVRS